MVLAAEAGAGLGLLIKGAPTKVFQAFGNTGESVLSDIEIDCRQANALHLDIDGSDGLILSVQGAANKGGNYYPLPGPTWVEIATTGHRTVDMPIGAPWAKVYLEIVPSSTLVTVWATPFLSAGPLTAPTDCNRHGSGSAALGVGADEYLYLISPSKVRLLRLLGATITATVTGLYPFYIGTEIVARVYLTANQPHSFSIPGGARPYNSGIVGNDSVLGVRNQSGSTSTVTASAWALEEAP